MTKGTAICVGVGPGDPELMTLKAARVIRENDVIALPGKEPRETAAYRIAVRAVPELADKTLVPLEMPMRNDRDALRPAHRACADVMERYLDRGSNVVYLTLGDPSVYCTFGYLQRLLRADGYDVEIISGVPSFCAAAARLGMPLAEWDEALHILPACRAEREDLSANGNFVLMKSGGQMKRVKELLRESGMSVRAVENCGMAEERCYGNLEEIPDDAGYFSLIIARADEKN